MFMVKRGLEICPKRFRMLPFPSVIDCHESLHPFKYQQKNGRFRYWNWQLQHVPHPRCLCADGRCSLPAWPWSLSPLLCVQHCRHPLAGRPDSCCPSRASPWTCSGKSTLQGSCPASHWAIKQRTKRGRHLRNTKSETWLVLVIWCTECLHNLRVDQLLPVVHHAPGCDAQRHHLVQGDGGSSGGVVPHRLSNTSAHTLAQACSQDPRSWRAEEVKVTSVCQTFAWL